MIATRVAIGYLVLVLSLVCPPLLLVTAPLAWWLWRRRQRRLELARLEFALTHPYAASQGVTPYTYCRRMLDDQ